MVIKAHDLKEEEGGGGMPFEWKAMDEISI